MPSVPTAHTGRDRADRADHSGRSGRPGRAWARFLLRRLLGLGAVLTVLVTATFLILQLVPGDPSRAAVGVDASPAEVEAMRHSLGLDRPLAQQFASYVGGLFTGDLGTSFQTGEPVSQIIATRLPFTAQLAVFSVLAALLIAVPVGLAVAVACRGGRRRPLDSAFTTTAAVVGCTPEYIAGTLLVLLFAVTLGWLPAAGAATPASLVLPVVAIALSPAAALARIVRREAAVVLEEDYLRTARAKRLGGWALYARHTLPNLLTSALTMGGLLLAGLMGGTVIVESVFAWPGLGSRVVQAILVRDFPVIQGIVLVIGIMAAVINLLVDVCLGVLDPRTLTGKTEEASSP